MFSPGRTRASILILAIAGAVYLCWLMIQPFVAVISWAAALAILAHPLHRWMELRMRPGAAAFISMLLVIAVIVAPAALVSQQLFVELQEILRGVGADLSSDRLRGVLDDFPALARLLTWLRANPDLDGQLRATAAALAGKASGVLTGSFWILTEWVLTFLTLFYFFRDRAGLLTFLRGLIPLSGAETEDLLDRIALTVNASLYKNLLVKAIQGVLGGLMFWILGLPAPVLFGAAMAMLAILPVMGTALVWVPAAIFLAVTGSWIKAIVLAAWGGLVVGLIDNFLFPLLVAEELHLHPLAVFFSVFGGVLAFGMAGAVLGPAILAIAVALLDHWRQGGDEAGAG